MQKIAHVKVILFKYIWPFFLNFYQKDTEIFTPNTLFPT